MGLSGPKSLLPVRSGKSFLEILLRQASVFRMAVGLMNSFSTHEQTLHALASLKPKRMPEIFLQHKFPKILQGSLAPARNPGHEEMEWNPPGHGDIYTAMETSGFLDRLLDEGIVYAFISNSDNLGATPDPCLLGYFAQENFPFLMEVAEKTPADIKGGHLARHKNGFLLLRESAQCPENELAAFTDIQKYRFFNTNNLWVNLHSLKRLIQKEKTIALPMILNPKTLNPREENSPPVFQIETAMGAAISLFEGASAVCVPRSRFMPVKKCSDLLAVRSDYYLFTDETWLVPNPDRRSDFLTIRLDSRYYGKIDRFDSRFPQGPPSLKNCTAFTVSGDVLFEGEISAQGNVVVRNSMEKQIIIPKGTPMEGELVF
jgi:UTP--glucose-1-phosphate uridylyltransferase